jgi:hypothetical protein
MSMSSEDITFSFIFSSFGTLLIEGVRFFNEVEDVIPYKSA